MYKFIFGLVFLILIIGLIFLQRSNVLSDKTRSTSPQVLEPSPTPDLSWKIYKNEFYEYQIGYPYNWVFRLKDASLVSFISDCDLEKDKVCSKVEILGLDQRKENLQPQFIVDTNRVEKPDKIFESREFIFAGEQAVEIVYWQGNYPKEDGKYGRLIYMLIFNHQNRSYQISYEETQKDLEIQSPLDWKNRESLNQILETFKFLD